MGSKVLSQAAAWEAYDDWLAHGHAIYVEEPPSLEPIFRFISQSWRAAPKDWADSYICAFARTSGLQLVTFDQVLQKRTLGSILLGP
jgi:predicted nucleic acid-binding protein